MPKFDQLEVSPQQVAGELRPSFEGAQAFERAANTEREYNQINLRSRLHGAEMLGHSIGEARGALDEMQRKADEQHRAIASSDATNMATDAEIANKYGITGPLGTAGSEGQRSGGGGGDTATTGISVKDPNTPVDGPVNSDGTPLKVVHPQQGDAIISDGISKGMALIDQKGQAYLAKYGQADYNRFWLPHAARLRADLLGHAAREQQIVDSNKVMTNIEEVANVRAGELVKHPEDLDEHLQKFEEGMRQGLGGFSHLSAEERVKIDNGITKSAGALVRAALLGYSFTPEGVQKGIALLDSNKYDKYLDASKEEKVNLYKKFNEAKDRLYTEAQHQRTLKQQAARDGQAKLLTDAGDKIMSGQFSGENEAKLMLNPAFQDDPEGVEIAHKYIENMRKMREGTATFVDPVLSTRTKTKFIYDMGRKIGDPDRLADFREVTKAWAVDHTISWKDYQEAQKEWTETRGKEATGSKEQLNKWFQDHEKDWFTAPSGADQLAATANGKTMFTHSILAGQRIDEVRAYAEKRAAELVQQGKDPSVLFTPGNPEYLGNKIKPVTQEEEAIFREHQQAEQTKKLSFAPDENGNPDYKMESLAKSFRNTESGSPEGNYALVGPEVTYRSGPHKGMKDHAYGAYQVMGVNVGDWTEKYLGVRMTPEEFRQDRKAQDMVFQKRMQEYLDRHGGDIGAAARDWFGHGKADVLGTTPDVYEGKIMRGFHAARDWLFGKEGVFENHAPNSVQQGNPAPVNPVSDLPAPKHTSYTPGTVNAVTNESARTINSQGYGARMTGSMTIGNATFQFETGGRGRGSAPLGTYTITRFTSGDQRAAAGQKYTRDAFELSDARDTAPATQGQPPRQGLLIHEWAGGQSLGCLEIPSAQWPAFKKAMIEELNRNGKVTLNLGTPHQQVAAQSKYTVPQGFQNFLHNPENGQFFDPNTGKLYDAGGKPLN